MEMSAWTTCNYRWQQQQTTGKKHGGKNTEWSGVTRWDKEVERKQGWERRTGGKEREVSALLTGNKKETENMVGHIM